MPDGIRQRGNSYLVDVTVGGVRRTRTIKGLHLDKARLAQAALRSELLRTVGAEVERQDTWTLKQALDKTTSISWSDKESADHLVRNAEMVIEILGPETLQEQGNSNGTVNRKLAALSKMLTVAMQRGKLNKKPHIQRRDEAECRIRFLSPEEERAALSILNLWGKADHSDAFTVLIDTGMRPRRTVAGGGERRRPPSHQYLEDQEQAGA